MNRPIINKQIELATNNLSTKRNLSPCEVIGEFYQTFKDITPIIYKLSENRGEETTFQFLL